MRPSDYTANLALIPGLAFKYYEIGLQDKIPPFYSMQPVKVGFVPNFDLSVKNLSDKYGIQFTGYINIPIDGTYTFHTTSDDGSRLYIGEQLVVDNDGIHAAIEKSGTIDLKKGHHSIRVDFFERLGADVLIVSCTAPGQAKAPIPSEFLFRPAQVAVSPVDTKELEAKLLAEKTRADTIQVNFNKLQAELTQLKADVVKKDAYIKETKPYFFPYATDAELEEDLAKYKQTFILSKGV